MIGFTKTEAKTRKSRRSMAYRVAIPAWRLVGIHVTQETPDETVSRDEIELLFSDVLRRKGDPVRLNEQEIRAHRQTARIRAALTA